MSDWLLLIEIANQTLACLERIERRFSGITNHTDFIKNDAGIDRLDGIGMMLIAIGENLKKFEVAGGKPLMDKHPEIDWKGAKGVRDFLSHHYCDLDAEVIFMICQNRIADLKSALCKIKEQLEQEVAK